MSEQRDFSKLYPEEYEAYKDNRNYIEAHITGAIRDGSFLADNRLQALNLEQKSKVAQALALLDEVRAELSRSKE